VTRARRAVYAAVVGVVCLLALEGAARVVLREAALASIPAETVRAHVTHGDIVYDPVLGWKRTHLPDPLLGLDVNGFRHAEVHREKAPGTLRGFALGDSQTYGAGVDPGQDYPSVAEARLRAAGLPVELVNAGLSGYGSRQVWRLLNTQLLAFDPDFLIIDCRAEDDVRDDDTSFGGGGLDGIERFLFYSRLYRGLRLVVSYVDPRDGAPMHKEPPRGPPLPGVQPPPEDAAGHPRLGNHDLLQTFAVNHGIDLWFVDYPFTGAPVAALATADRLPPGAAIIPAAEALAATGRPAGELFLDNNHLTVLGNEVVGDAVAKAIGPRLAARAGMPGAP
jgi:hypothetical protein